MEKSLTVEIWSDLICPWCWIGKRRLERALAAFPQREQLRIVHHPYRLHPARSASATPQPVETLLATHYGLSPQQVRSQLQQIERTAAGEGLQMRLGGSLIGDTLHGHRLVQFAATLGQQEVMLERLYRAYFSEQQSLYNRDSLLALAIEAGLPGDAAAAVLDGTQFTTQVEDSQSRAHSMGARGVPLFLIGGRHAVSGAQSAEHFTAVLQRAWEEAIPISTATADGVCDDNGCTIPDTRGRT